MSYFVLLLFTVYLLMLLIARTTQYIATHDYPTRAKPKDKTEKRKKERDCEFNCKSEY